MTPGGSGGRGHVVLEANKGTANEGWDGAPFRRGGMSRGLTAKVQVRKPTL